MNRLLILGLALLLAVSAHDEDGRRPRPRPDPRPEPCPRPRGPFIMIKHAQRAAVGEKANFTFCVFSLKALDKSRISLGKLSPDEENRSANFKVALSDIEVGDIREKCFDKEDREREDREMDEDRRRPIPKFAVAGNIVSRNVSCSDRGRYQIRYDKEEIEERESRDDDRDRRPRPPHGAGRFVVFVKGCRNDSDDHPRPEPRSADDRKDRDRKPMIVVDRIEKGLQGKPLVFKFCVISRDRLFEALVGLGRLDRKNVENDFELGVRVIYGDEIKKVCFAREREDKERRERFDIDDKDDRRRKVFALVGYAKIAKASCDQDARYSVSYGKDNSKFVNVVVAGCRRETRD